MFGSRQQCILRAICGALTIIISSQQALAQAAQSPDDERRALINEASAARASGDDARALTLAMRAASIRMSTSLRLMIADEQFRVGQLIASLGSAELCISEAELDPALANRENIAERCRSLRASIEPRVARIFLRLPSPIPAGFRVEIGGLPLDLASISHGVLVLSGNVEIAAHRSNGSSHVQTVNALAGQRTEATIAFEPVASEPHFGGPIRIPPPPPPRRAAFPTGPVVVAGAGGVALIGGFVFLGLRESATSGCTVLTETIVCPDEAHTRTATNAPTFHDTMIGSFVVGGAAVAGALTWYFLARPREQARPSVALSGTYNHLGIYGTF